MEISLSQENLAISSFIYLLHFEEELSTLQSPLIAGKKVFL